MKRFVSRIDKEIICPKNISTNIHLAIIARLNLKSHYELNEEFDKWAAKSIKQNPDLYKIIIGWSGMSLNTIRQAKLDNKITIIERGSSHIRYQNEILIDEYKRYGLNFSIDAKTIDKEEAEYSEADFITIPSQFVKQTFLENSIPEAKLIHIPYGVSLYFNKENLDIKNNKRFKILYLGTLSIRKGLVYLFEAIKLLTLKETEYEVWFIGNVSKEIEPFLEKNIKNNWKIFGHVNHYKLADYIVQCDIGIQPSIEEGLSMVIPQMLGCGVPVIATYNTGAGDFIKNGVNGYIIPIRSSRAISDHITLLYENKILLNELKQHASLLQKEYSWDDYGTSYGSILNSLL
ncbi:glycosyltransferase family 4 protein [Tellurirhabdus bombi]|uniref:glycosyltransferase family 4 protein n=1 Tax=Tellurirhabdus bombi TaxID=2907205 RepID=UPI001F1A7755|nr:glycosyltransferase family 4 protein [Tellurirhabdus bombi]